MLRIPKVGRSVAHPTQRHAFGTAALPRTCGGPCSPITAPLRRPRACRTALLVVAAFCLGAAWCKRGHGPHMSTVAPPSSTSLAAAPPPAEATPDPAATNEGADVAVETVNEADLNPPPPPPPRRAVRVQMELQPPPPPFSWTKSKNAVVVMSGAVAQSLLHNAFNCSPDKLESQGDSIRWHTMRCCSITVSPIPNVCCRRCSLF